MAEAQLASAADLACDIEEGLASATTATERAALVPEELIRAIDKLKAERDAVILAHYYVSPEVQAVADYVGDSFYLAKLAKSLPQQHSKHRALTAIPAARKPRKRQNRHHRRAEHPLNQRAAHAQRSFYPGQKPASNVSAAHRYCFLCQSPSPAFVGLWLHCMASRHASLSFFSANRGNHLTQ